MRPPESVRQPGMIDGISFNLPKSTAPASQRGCVFLPIREFFLPGRDFFAWQGLHFIKLLAPAKKSQVKLLLMAEGQSRG